MGTSDKEVNIFDYQNLQLDSWTNSEIYSQSNFLVLLLSIKLTGQ